MKRKYKFDHLSSFPVVLLSGFLILTSVTGCAWISDVFGTRNSEENQNNNPSSLDISESQNTTDSQEELEAIDWDAIWYKEISYERKPYTYEGSLTWDEVKPSLLNDALDENAIANLETEIRERGISLESPQIEEAIGIFRELEDAGRRSLIFEALFSGFYNLKGSSEAYNFFLEIAQSDDRELSPKALSALLYLENEVDQSGRDRWDNYSWSEELKSILEKAVNEELFKLSHLSIDGDLILLRLFEYFPDSKLTNGAKLYGQISGGESYVGPYLSLPDDVSAPVLRTPISSEELKAWSSFLEEFPDHPASDNVMYRVARIYELEGNYAEALVHYHKASTMPDGALSETAKERVLFIADFLMDSESLEALSRRTEHESLIPFLEYTSAVHLIREDDIERAIEKFDSFSEKYSPKRFLGLVKPRYWETGDIEPSSTFWENFRRQRKNLGLLSKIQSRKDTDAKIYQEASFWFYNQLTAYNYLWRGFQSITFSSFIPFQWEGQSTAATRLLSYDMVQRAGNAYDNQSGYLISIELLESLLENFPESNLREKALYSILTNYYWMSMEGSAVSINLTAEWQDEASRYIDRDSENPSLRSGYVMRAAIVDTAQEFVDLFPTSSMADDALLTIMVFGNDSETFQARQQLLEEYPNSDRIEEVNEMLESQ